MGHVAQAHHALHRGDVGGVPPHQVDDLDGRSLPDTRAVPSERLRKAPELVTPLTVLAVVTICSRLARGRHARGGVHSVAVHVPIVFQQCLAVVQSDADGEAIAAKTRSPEMRFMSVAASRPFSAPGKTQYDLIADGLDDAAAVALRDLGQGAQHRGHQAAGNLVAARLEQLAAAGHVREQNGEGWRWVIAPDDRPFAARPPTAPQVPWPMPLPRPPAAGAPAAFRPGARRPRRAVSAHREGRTTRRGAKQPPSTRIGCPRPGFSLALTGARSVVCRGRPTPSIARKTPVVRVWCKAPGAAPDRRWRCGAASAAVPAVC